MLIVGAKGFAKEVLEVICQKDPAAAIVFYDDLSTDLPALLYDTYPILRSMEEAEAYFKNTDSRFTLGIGGPHARYKLYEKMQLIGGKLTSTISPFAHIGRFGNIIGEGCNIMTGAVITDDIHIGRGTLINLNCTIGHDCTLGEFVEMSPGVNISGNCIIENNVNIGTNAVVIPKIRIGTNAIIAAGSVVTKDVPANVMVAGVPAVVKKELG
jgi:sugar O-acyltransferase (sialic acid O-acetyltransferase NeuD family)